MQLQDITNLRLLGNSQDGTNAQARDAALQSKLPGNPICHRSCGNRLLVGRLLPNQLA
jgi:hypothetical protein